MTAADRAKAAEVLRCTTLRFDPRALEVDALAAALAAARADADARWKAAVEGLAEPGDPNARMDAYYYGFERTGVGIIDAILSAVAQAGKSYHSTEKWTEDAFGAGSPESWIQAAADAAAARLRGLVTGNSEEGTA